MIKIGPVTENEYCSWIQNSFISISLLIELFVTQKERRMDVPIYNLLVFYLS
jgi:hypothetical protein